MSYLDNVPEQNAFVLSNGKKVMNLDELYLVLNSSEESVFYYHVNDEKNDFASWINACIHHNVLADKLANMRNKQQFLKCLGEEIDMIKNPSLRETAEFFKPDINDENNSSKDSSKDMNLSKNPNNVSSASVDGLVPVDNPISASAKETVDTLIPVASTTNINDSAPVTVAVGASTSAPVAEPVASPVSVSAAETVASPVSVSAAETVVSPIAATITDSSTDTSPVKSIIDEIFEFEQILKNLIDEINTEIFSWSE